MMAGNMVPPMLAPKLDKNVPEGAAGNTPKSNLPWNPPKNDGNRLKKLFKNLIIVALSHGLNNNISQLEIFCQNINIFLQ